MKHYAYNSPFDMVDKDGNKYKLTIEQDEYSEDPREWDNLTTMVCWHRRYSLGDKHDFNDVHDMLEDLAYQADIKYDEDINTPDLMTKLAPYYLIKPLYLYDHSGISMSTSSGYPYNDRWDAGVVGYAYISKNDVIKECLVYVLDENGERIKIEHQHADGRTTYSYKTTPATEETWRKRASEIIDNEVEAYDMYLRGDVYGYKLEKEVVVKDKCPHCDQIIKTYTEWEIDDSCAGYYGDCLEENGIRDEVYNLEFVE
jgi:hypothetical protein